MNNDNMFCAYWMGFQGGGNDLGSTPNYVNTVNLFVAGPADDGKSLTTNYLTKAYSKQQQISWVRQLQANGTEVLMSLLDTPSMHWNNVDIPAFVQNVKDEVIDGDWGLNGIDIDLESGMPPSVWSQKFIELIEAFRSVLGPKGSTNAQGKQVARLSVVAYRPSMEQQILQTTGSELDWLNTMAYWNDASQNEQMFQTYSQYVDQVNLGIGVDYQNSQSTPLDQVIATAQFAAHNANCGMMQYTLNTDCEAFTGQNQWTWASAIHNNL